MTARCERGRRTVHFGQVVAKETEDDDDGEREVEGQSPELDDGHRLFVGMSVGDRRVVESASNIVLERRLYAFSELSTSTATALTWN